MSGLEKDWSLTNLLKLLYDHQSEIQKSEGQVSPFIKVKKGMLDGIHIGDICTIFALSHNSFAKTFCFSFGMQSATPIEFEKMINRLKEAALGFPVSEGYINYAEAVTVLKARRNLPYIDVMHAASILRIDNDRDVPKDRKYSDYNKYVPKFQCLDRVANGYYRVKFENVALALRRQP